MRKSTT